MGHLIRPKSTDCVSQWKKKSVLQVLTDCVSPGVFLDHLVNSEILPDASSLLKPLVLREALFSLLLVVSTLKKRI